MTRTTGKSSRLEQLFFWGRPFSPLYGWLMRQRESLYQKGIFRQAALEVPVISAGNLVLGGTGKTPLVIYLAQFLLNKGKKPAILSRGYKGSASGSINIVSDGRNILMSPESAGDEPRLLSEKLPHIPVITGKDRWTTGRFAVDSYKVDHIILDDGFQHLALKRDLDLVLFNAGELLGNGRVLPGGNLREPLSALKRADAFIISGPAYDDHRVHEFTEVLGKKFPDTPIFTGSYKVGKVMVRTLAGKSETLTTADGSKMRLFGFCGIARPESFRKTLEKAGMRLVGFQSFADHHHYSPNDIMTLCDISRSSGAEALITTEKDLVKVRGLWSGDFPLLTLPVDLNMENGFDRFLTAKLNSFRNPSTG